jgi:hypothetical protein
MRREQKKHFSWRKNYEIAIPIIILANYAANAFFHAMEIQNPVRTSCADVLVVEKKMDKVLWDLTEVSWYDKVLIGRAEK